MLARVVARLSTAARPVITSQTRSFNALAHKQKLITHWATPESRAYFDRISSVISDRYSIGAGLAEPQPINWDSWEKEIHDKEFLAKVRKEYESLSFNIYSGKQDESEAAKWNELVALAEKRVDFMNELLLDLNDKLAQAIYDRECIFRWNSFHMLDRMPGLEKEITNEIVAEMMLPCEEDWHWAKIDVHSMMRQLKEGKQPHIKELEGITVLGTTDFAKIRAEFDKRYEETGGNLLEKAAKIIEDQVAAQEKVMGKQMEKAKKKQKEDAAASLAFKTAQLKTFRLEAETIESEERLGLASRRFFPDGVVAKYLAQAVKVIFAPECPAATKSSLSKMVKDTLAKQEWSDDEDLAPLESSISGMIAKGSGDSTEVAILVDKLVAVR